MRPPIQYDSSGKSYPNSYNRRCGFRVGYRFGHSCTSKCPPGETPSPPPVDRWASLEMAWLQSYFGPLGSPIRWSPSAFGPTYQACSAAAPTHTRRRAVCSRRNASGHHRQERIVDPPVKTGTSPEKIHGHMFRRHPIWTNLPLVSCNAGKDLCHSLTGVTFPTGVRQPGSG